SKHYGEDGSHPTFFGGTGIGPTVWSEAPFNNNQDLYVLKDDYSQVFGNHIMKLGALLSIDSKNEDSGGGAPAESPQSWGATGFNGWSGSTGNRFADFLLKDMSWGFSETNRQTRALLRWKDVEIYGSDSWRITPRMTVDFGARFSYFPNPYQADGTATSF